MAYISFIPVSDTHNKAEQYSLLYLMSSLLLSLACVLNINLPDSVRLVGSHSLCFASLIKLHVLAYYCRL